MNIEQILSPNNGKQIMKENKDVNWFIEEFYPEHSRQEIADEMDLHIILYDPESMTEDSNAMRTYKEYSQEDLDNNQLKLDWLEARIGVLERAIEGYLESDDFEITNRLNELTK